jgi:hypothetical protein
MADAGQHGPQREVPPAVKAIEAELRAEVSLHERDAAMLVGEATAHRDLPYVLAALCSVGPKDALEARLAALLLPLTSPPDRSRAPSPPAAARSRSLQR